MSDIFAFLTKNGRKGNFVQKLSIFLFAFNR